MGTIWGTVFHFEMDRRWLRSNIMCGAPRLSCSLAHSQLGWCHKRTIALLETEMNFTLYANALSRFLVLFIATTIAFADDDPKEPTYPVDVLSIQTILVDANDQPIDGVRSTVNGLRCLEDRGSWYGWPSENIGKVQESQSQTDGTVEFRYPVKFGVPEKWLTTTTLDISFSHPEYVANRTEITLADIPQKIKFESGCKVLLSAIDDSGKPVERFFPMVASRDGPPNWVFTPGNAKTGCMSKGKQMCMLVSPSESRPLFSKLFEFETASEKMVIIPNILVQPGKRVFGKLPDNVPRPIVNGSVSINVLMTPDAPLGGREPVEWTDSALIAEDGTFEFKSVPGPAQVQVIAICRGWVIRSSKEGRVNGQTFDLLKEQSELEVAFEMEQTGDVHIELMSVDGESVVGAKVYTCPNKVLLSGGSQLLTRSWRSIDYIERLLKGETKSSPWNDESSTNRHYQISDDEGMVTLRDIPVGSEESISVHHPKYDLPYESGEVRNNAKFRVNAGETEERLLVLQKREQPRPKEQK